MKLDNFLGPGPIDSVQLEQALIRAERAGGESFDDHLWRVGARPQETASEGRADAARPASPQTSPTERQDPANVSSDQTNTAQASPEPSAESQRPEANEAKTDAAEAEPSGTPEADAEDKQQDEQTSADGGPGETTAGDHDQAADGEANKGNAAQSTAGRIAAEHEGNNPQGLPHAGPTGQASEPDAAAANRPEQEATEGTPPAKGLSKENLARATSVEGSPPASPGNAASGETGGEGPDTAAHNSAGQTPGPARPGEAATAAGSRDCPGQQRHGVDDAAGQQHQATVRLRQAIGPRGPQQGRTGDATARPAHESVQEQRTDNPANPAPAANRQPDAWAVSSERNADAPDSLVKPAAGATVDGPFNVPLRVPLPQKLPLGSTPQRHEATEPGQLDRGRFVRRVAGAFEVVGKRNGSVRLRLSPPELGSLRLEISIHDGTMTARVEAETATARNLLLDNLPALRDRLAQQDIKVKQFEVDLMDQSPGGLPDQTANQAQSQHRDRGHAAVQPNREGDAATAAPRDPGIVSRPGEGTQLNVLI